METISSQVAMNNKETLLDDRNFIVKFVGLMMLIVLLASYVVFQGVVTIDKLSLPFTNHSFSSLKLEKIEKSLNGNAVDLRIMENDFDDLAELDLSDIEILDKSMDTALVKEEVARTSVESPKVTKPVSKKKKVFISSKSVASLSFIKKKFYATNNIHFSLLLSQRFYDKKQYDKALKWALISNEIDENNEKSWVLFAKSKMKLGKPQDALNALNVYLKNQNSSQVKKVLDDIKKTI